MHSHGSPQTFASRAHTWLAEKNWNMRLTGVGDHLGELKVIKKTNATEVHKGRLQDVRRSKQLSHR